MAGLATDGRPTLAAVESCRAPLFNHYDDGGVLIWCAPDRPVFVDSRQDPYPLPFMLDAIAVERGDRPYQPLFARWGIGCAFLKASSKMTDRLPRRRMAGACRRRGLGRAGPPGDAVMPPASARRPVVRSDGDHGAL